MSNKGLKRKQRAQKLWNLQDQKNELVLVIMCKNFEKCYYLHRPVKSQNKTKTQDKKEFKRMATIPFVKILDQLSMAPQ